LTFSGRTNSFDQSESHSLGVIREALPMSGKYTLGLDFGTNSVRALIVDVRDGRELASYVSDYSHGDVGVILRSDHPDLARQHPADYLRGIETAVTQAMEFAAASSSHDFSWRHIIGIGVDTTGSTPLPVDRNGNALALQAEFENDPDAMAWLWKDHTAHAEAEEITAAAQLQRPAFLVKCGGRYSSEWFWAKILRCARVAPRVFEAAQSWVEIADWIPAVMSGTTAPDRLRRGACAAGHKCMYNTRWGGFPDKAFLSSLHPGLARIGQSLPSTCATVADAAGGLSAEWATKLNLPAGIPVAVGAFDAHLGAIGAGIQEGTLVKVMGTSTCDIMVMPMERPLADVPGLCGIADESVLPGYYGLEAGQSAVGDIFNWFVRSICPGGPEQATHESLTAAAAAVRPGENGLLTLDWHNGNRTVLVDQRLTGLTVGLTLHSTPGEIYRSLIEATAFGARVIMERFEEYGVAVKRVVNCGGVAARSPLAMQIYADALNRSVAVSRSTQTCALGSAIAAAVAAGPDRGGHADFTSAMKAMSGVPNIVYDPQPANVAIYNGLYKLYVQLHDAFGVRERQAALSNVMKDLLDIRDEVRSH
jgi:L-ribulokinase